MKTLSIIIPHFNSTALLPTLLDSIPLESWLDVIVVDDHSNEVEVAKLNQLMLDYPAFRLFSAPVGKKGPGVARNEGVKQSEANYVLFADSDDYFTENAFELINPYLVSDNEVIYFAPDSINVNSDQQGTRHDQYAQLVLGYLKTSDDNLFLKYYSPCSKVISRNLLLEHDIQFDNGVGGEDNNFSLKVAYYSRKITADQNVIYIITESDDSLTSHYSKQVLENHFYAMSRYNDFLQSKNMHKYQAPMLGWIVKARKISYTNMFHWFFICLRKGYPIKFLYFLKKFNSL